MKLPDYVVIDDESQSKERREILRTPAKEVTFPLTEEDQDCIRLLEAFYEKEEHMAGLAAPQIGISKRIMLFAAPDDPQLKKWRPDHEQIFPKTIWLNPTYAPLPGKESDTTIDFEACYSVKNFAGPVERYTEIQYTAQLPDGTKVAGQAKGFAARSIQHEIDHLNGILFIDKVPEGELLELDEYRQRRTAKLAEIQEV